jgi:aspartate ammonia-lyase
MRQEKDFLGTKEIPDECYYGINTARALENFGFGGEIDRYFLKAYLLVKKACALANKDIKCLDQNKSDAIISAIDEMLDKQLYSDICVNPLSGGAGTSINMNINEVIANRALEMAGMNKGEYSYLSPLDDVNMHQSTNDTFPTALKTALLFYLNDLEAVFTSLQESLQAKEKEFAHIVKLGRTEMQDALPLTVGMQFSAYSEAVGRDRWRIFKSRERIKTVNLGGTAIGTGFNAPREYIWKAADKLKELTGLNISRAENLIDATQNLDSIVEVSGIIKAAAVNLMKMAEDFRLLSSGPEGGLGEFILPAMQEGSTIMPGKVNPVIPEFVTQSCLQVMANDMTLTMASAMGNLELNQFYPLVAHMVLMNFRLVREAASALDLKVVRGIKLNESKITHNLTNSVAIMTYLSQFIGHDKAAQVYEKHKNTGKSAREILAEDGILTPDKYDELVKPDRMMMLGFKKD